jgi:hypothetical protein
MWVSAMRNVWSVCLRGHRSRQFEKETHPNS